MSCWLRTIQEYYCIRNASGRDGCRNKGMRMGGCGVFCLSLSSQCPGPVLSVSVLLFFLLLSSDFVAPFPLSFYLVHLVLLRT